MIKLLVKDTVEPIARENMKRLQKELSETQVILRGNWKFFELTFNDAVTNFKQPHGFNFIPKDIIQTSITGGNFLIWNYEDFDFDNLDITTTGACVVRAFIGSYAEESGAQ